MERVNRLLSSPGYRAHLEALQKYEEDRLFCRHHLDHFLDVARLCWIYLLEERGAQAYSRDLVYAAALLHDIGRWMEYEGLGCHARGSAELAGPLLTEAGYSPEESRLITAAVLEHRQKEGAEFSSPLGYFLRKADKHSRLCFHCSARSSCYKAEEMPQGRQLLY